jgi:hypothetical protein
MVKNIERRRILFLAKAISSFMVLLMVLIPTAAFGASILQETPEPFVEPDAVVPESGQQIFLEDTWWLWTILIVISLLILLGLYLKSLSAERADRSNSSD